MSSFIPISGQVPITIGGVVSTVCALTKYMPISQDITTGITTVTSLNVNVFNATQLAVYFTASYPNASPHQVNNAVDDLIKTRIKTDFGLSPEEFTSFLKERFGGLPDSTVFQEKTRQSMPSRKESQAPKDDKTNKSYFSAETEDNSVTFFAKKSAVINNKSKHLPKPP